jgi:DNA-binding FadR family transcriptional regulator
VNDAVPEIQALQRRELIYNTVQDAIKAYIVDHSLKPGDMLPPETDLAEQLRVSRNSVREAVKSLQTLGILQVRRGAGLFVSDFSFDPLLDHLGYGILVDLKNLADLLEIRALIECGMAPRILAAVTPDQLRQLLEVAARMRGLAEEGGYSAEDDRTFHELLYVNVDNRVVAKLLDVFW